MVRNRIYIKEEVGYALVLFLVLLAVTTTVVAATLKIAESNSRTTHAVKLRSENYYHAESGVTRAVSWLRTNSQSLTTPFNQSNFANNFTRTAPTVGSNDTGLLQVPTKIKRRGTNNSVILSTDNDFVTSAFPLSQHIVSGVSFDPATTFAAQDLSTDKVRITLVDALPLDPTKDSPPLASAQTDYYPIYRVDGVTDTNKGSHVFGYVVGSLFYVDTIGFYGRDFVNVDQDCTSYPFAGPNPGQLNAKCPIGSNGLVTVKNNAEVYGSVKTNGSINKAGGICADYPSCTNPGTECHGSSCAVPGLPTFQTWATYCPANLGNITANANQTVMLNTPGCYNTVTINNKGNVTLTNTSAPYYIKTLTISGGSPLTKLNTAPSPAGGTVQMYVETITGNNLNGNQTVNATSRPSQLKIYYLGNSDLILNGTANMAFALVAPYAGVTVSGNSTFYGGIIAKNLSLKGSATVVYDESLGGSNLNDMTYRLRNLEEYYN